MKKKQPGKRKTANASAPPPTILSNVAWAFRGEPFADATAFDRAVREWQDGSDAWVPDEIIPLGRLRVAYQGAGDDPGDIEYTRYVIDLASDNGKSFTALELLHKLHNAVVVRLRETDHQYFEGLDLKDRATLLYDMEQGS